jgi:hypothetical protein
MGGVEVRCSAPQPPLVFTGLEQAGLRQYYRDALREFWQWWKLNPSRLVLIQSLPELPSWLNETTRFHLLLSLRMH